MVYEGPHRVGCARVQRVCLSTGDPKDPVKGLELAALYAASPCQEACRSAPEGGASAPEAEVSALEARK